MYSFPYNPQINISLSENIKVKEGSETGSKIMIFQSNVISVGFLLVFQFLDHVINTLFCFLHITVL